MLTKGQTVGCRPNVGHSRKRPCSPSLADLVLLCRCPALPRDVDQVPVSRLQDQGFHILIPTVLGLILLAVLGLVVKRVVQRRRGERLGLGEGRTERSDRPCVSPETAEL